MNDFSEITPYLQDIVGLGNTINSAIDAVVAASWFLVTVVIPLVIFCGLFWWLLRQFIK